MRPSATDVAVYRHRQVSCLNCYIFCKYLRIYAFMCASLQEGGAKGTDNLIYTSEKGERIENMKTEWTNQYIIYSPKIVEG